LGKRGKQAISRHLQDVMERASAQRAHDGRAIRPIHGAAQLRYGPIIPAAT
jgi:hypothetical protein